MFPWSVIRDCDELLRGGPRWRAILDRYHVDVVVWPRARSLASLVAEAPGWRRLYRDHDWVVYTR
jgi:hypothetical protein